MADPYLVGSEDVRSAGHRMAQAAQDMQQAANTIAAALDQHQRFLADWLQRVAEVVEAARPAGGR